MLLPPRVLGCKDGSLATYPVARVKDRIPTLVTRV